METLISANMLLKRICTYNAKNCILLLIKLIENYKRKQLSNAKTEN